MKMDSVLPAHVNLAIDVDGDLCNFTYRETFDKRHARTVARTAEFIDNAIAAGAMPKGVTMERTRLGIVFVGKGVRRSDLGNMMFGEFMLWASIADTTLREFITATLHAGRATTGVKAGE